MDDDEIDDDNLRLGKQHLKGEGVKAYPKRELEVENPLTNSWILA